MSSKTKSKKEISPEAMEEAEKLVEEINASDDDSIASLEVSEHEEQQKPEQKNKKKRKRPSDDSEEERDNDDNQYGLMEVKKAALDSSAISSPNVELWLFKVPKNLPLATFSQKTIKLGGTIAHEANTYTIKETSALECDSLLNVWPNVKSEKLVLGKPFSKMIHVAETHSSSTTEPTQVVANLAAFLRFGIARSPSTARYDEKRQHDLKVRYAPAGAEVPHSPAKSAVNPFVFAEKDWEPEPDDEAPTQVKTPSKLPKEEKKDYEHKKDKKDKKEKHKHKEDPAEKKHKDNKEKHKHKDKSGSTKH